MNFCGKYGDFNDENRQKISALVFKFLQPSTSFIIFVGCNVKETYTSICSGSTPKQIP